MTTKETTDCSLRQWQGEIQRQVESGELAVKVRSPLGGAFPLGEIPEYSKTGIIEMIEALADGAHGHSA
jgi:hypothetical protein